MSDTSSAIKFFYIYIYKRRKKKRKKENDRKGTFVPCTEGFSGRGCWEDGLGGSYLLFLALRSLSTRTSLGPDVPFTGKQRWAEREDVCNGQMLPGTSVPGVMFTSVSMGSHAAGFTEFVSGLMMFGYQGETT